ncbi:hypothetical protein MKZ38_008278 [Zalerion maritima]|uniref:Synaptobrevin n=1 Tax=Zalerion maritima TaxID=339359 RepID=A0AAD5RHV4_9PEZI|nr:hypothetical protein MKZ38_008278 [Zalerion maritima]
MSDLDLLLPRLQRSIQELESSRRRNEYEVNKLGVNIQYARSLLTSLEKDDLSIQLGGRRMELQTHLNEKRELLEGLEERHKSLQEAVLHDFSDDADSSEGEDILAAIIETPSESMDGRSTNQQDERSPVEPGDDEAQWGQQPTLSQDTRTSGTLRARPQPAQTQTSLHTEQSYDNDGEPSRTAATSSRSYAPSPSTPSIVPPHLNPSPASAAPANPDATAEELAIRERQTQEAIASSLLQMARQLKASTQDIGVSLEEDKDVLEKAGQGMEMTQGGMEGAQKRMRDLQTTQSGGGVWGILGGGGGGGGWLGGWLWEWKMYGIIAILWVLLVLVVFVGPKIRF